jgi:GntR family transcriptional regulator, transcriptional repressor for pyruvate dehydrogenase complex
LTRFTVSAPDKYLESLEALLSYELGFPRMESSAATSQDIVADTLRRWLALGRYLPGERLPTERALAEAMGVGRMTVRAAFRELIAEGLLATSRGRTGGTVVLEATSRRHDRTDRRSLRKDVVAHFEFRLAIEPTAASLAARRATKAARSQILRLAREDPDTLGVYRAVDSRLHVAIAAGSGNELIAEAIATARTDFFRWADVTWRRIGWDSLPPEMQDFRAKHEPLAEAVVDGEPELAAQLMRGHLEEARDQYLEALG